MPPATDGVWRMGYNRGMPAAQALNVLESVETQAYPGLAIGRVGRRARCCSERDCKTTAAKLMALRALLRLIDTLVAVRDC